MICQLVEEHGALGLVLEFLGPPCFVLFVFSLVFSPALLF